jgi:hypothetical protein
MNHHRHRLGRPRDDAHRAGIGDADHVGVGVAHKRAIVGLLAVAVLSSTLLGSRISPEARNRSRGRILPRAMPVMSGMTHSTSWMRCCVRNSARDGVMEAPLTGCQNHTDIFICDHKYVENDIYVGNLEDCDLMFDRAAGRCAREKRYLPMIQKAYPED